MLLEVDARGGLDHPLGQTEFDQLRMSAQQAMGKSILNSGARFAKDYDEFQQLPLTQFVPKQGYAPVHLISRGVSIIEKTAIQSSRLSRAMLRKRPRYTLDNKLESKIDEYYRDVIRPKSLLIESEEIALQQLKASAGIQQGLRQTPMTDTRTDAAYKMYSAQLEGSKIGAAGYMGITGALPVSEQERIAMYGEDMGAEAEMRPPGRADLSYKVFPRQYDGPRRPQTLPSGDYLPSAAFDYNEQERRLRERLAPLRDQIDLNWVRQNQEVYNAALVQQEEEIKAGAADTFNRWEALPGVDLNANRLLRYGPDDEVMLLSDKPPKGLSKGSWNRIKQYAFQNSLGSKVKRSLLDPIITKLPQFVDWVKDNKVATAATVAALGAAAGYQFGYIPENFAGIGQDALIAAGGMAKQGIAAGIGMVGAGLGAVGQGIGNAAAAVGGMFMPTTVKDALNLDMPAFMDAYNKGDAGAAIGLLTKNGVSKRDQAEWMAQMLEQKGVDSIQGVKFDPETGNFLESVLRNYVSTSAADTIFGKDKSYALQFLNNKDTQNYAGGTMLRDLFKEATGQDPNAGTGFIAKGKKFMADLADNNAYADATARAQGQWGFKPTNILNPGAAYGPGANDPNVQWAYQQQAPGRFRRALGYMGGIASGVYGMIAGDDFFASGAEALGNTLGLAHTAFGTAGAAGMAVLGSGLRNTALAMAGGYVGIFTRTGRSILKSSVLGLAGFIGSKINSPPELVAAHLATHRESLKDNSKYNGLQVAHQAAYDALGMQQAIQRAASGLLSEAVADLRYATGRTLNFAASAWKQEPFDALVKRQEKLSALEGRIRNLERKSVIDQNGKFSNIKTIIKQPWSVIQKVLENPQNAKVEQDVNLMHAYVTDPAQLLAVDHNVWGTEVEGAIMNAADIFRRPGEESKEQPVGGRDYVEDAHRSISLISQGTSHADRVAAHARLYNVDEEPDDGDADWTKLLMKPFSYAASMKKQVVPIIEEEKDGLEALVPEQRDLVDTLSKKDTKLTSGLMVSQPKKKRTYKTKNFGLLQGEIMAQQKPKPKMGVQQFEEGKEAMANGMF